MNLPEAIVLAGGLGTRLRPVVSDRPKVLAEVRARPFLTYLLTLLETQGCPTAILAVGFMADQVAEEYGSRYGRMELEYSLEAEPAGTGGAASLAASYLRGDEALVLNGDSILHDDYAPLVALRRAHEAAATVATVWMDDVSRYGVLSVQPSGRILAFDEKGGEGGGQINAGVYAISSDLLRGLEVPSSLERAGLPSWLDSGVWAWRSHGSFIDIGTPESYEHLKRNHDSYLGRLAEPAAGSRSSSADEGS